MTKHITRLRLPDVYGHEPVSLELEPTRDQFTLACALLLSHAAGDHGGGGRAAMFLLSLWNDSHHVARLVDMFYVDDNLHNSMITVLLYLRQSGRQIWTVVTDEDMQPVLRQWGKAFRIKK